MALLQLEFPAILHPQQQEEHRMGTLQMCHRRIGQRTVVVVVVVVVTEIA
jgi:hypothetical protein